MAELFFCEYRFDTRRLDLEGPDGPIEVRAKTLELLTYLIHHRNRFVPRDELVSHLWPDVTVTASSLTQCISELRHKLGDSSKEQRFIETRIKMGYRFVAMVYHRPTEQLEPLPPPEDPQVKPAGPRRVRRAWIPTLIAAVFCLGAASIWWWTRAENVDSPVLVVSLVANPESDRPEHRLALEVRDAVVAAFSESSLVRLAAEPAAAAGRNVLDLELTCNATEGDAELSAVLRNRSDGRVLWGWTWVLPSSADHREMAADIAARIEESVRSILTRAASAEGALQPEVRVFQQEHSIRIAGKGHDELTAG